MKRISSFVPDASALLKLEVGELAGILLVHLNSCKQGECTAVQNGLVGKSNFFEGDRRGKQEEYPGRQSDVDLALREAWAFLESAGFLVNKDHGWQFISRNGKLITSTDEFAAYFKDQPQKQTPVLASQGVYVPGDEYGFYRDLSALVQAATSDVLIVDPYLEEDLFNLYVSKISPVTTVRILSNRIGANVETVTRKYSTNRSIQLRSSPDIHDRVVFLDLRGWVIGQSIKDAAKKKPTYMVELNEPSLTSARNAHATIWAAAAVIV